MNARQLAAMQGYRPANPYKPGYLEGPFFFTGTFSYDDAAVTDHLNLRAAAAQVDPAWVQEFGANANPEVTLHAEAVQLLWVDEAAIAHADPEDIWKVFEGCYLVVGFGGKEQHISLGDCCDFVADVQEALDSDLATTTEYYKFRKQGPKLLNDPFEIDMRTATKLTVSSNAAATGSLLAADSGIRLKVWGWAASNALINGR